MRNAPYAADDAHRSNPARLHVALVGSPTDVPDIAPLLPRRWSAVRYGQVSLVDGADVLVLGGATPTTVAGARLLHPAATIVAVIDAWAPSTLLVTLLRAGADACIRAGSTHWMAEQVLGAQRLRHTRTGENIWAPWRHAA